VKADWSKQYPCSRPDLVRPHPRTTLEARARLKQYLDQRSFRRETLGAVLQANGITIEETREGIAEITQFFLSSVSQGEDWRELSSPCIEFLWNFGQFIGEQLIGWASGCRLRWIVENVSPRATEPRFVFRIAGYSGASESFDPDGLLLRLARAQMEGETVSELIVIAHMNRVLRLCAATER
jgi:hypothetical protein